jgi:hypothetical protein
VKFIHCFSQELKNKLLKSGFKLLISNNNLYIFENSPTLLFNFNQVDKKQFIFSNKMIF